MNKIMIDKLEDGVYEELTQDLLFRFASAVHEIESQGGMKSVIALPVIRNNRKYALSIIKAGANLLPHIQDAPHFSMSELNAHFDEMDQRADKYDDPIGHIAMRMKEGYYLFKLQKPHNQVMEQQRQNKEKIQFNYFESESESQALNQMERRDRDFDKAKRGIK